MTSGLARLEIKPSESRVGFWHPHLHVLVLSEFPLPQVLVQLWWSWAFFNERFDPGHLLIADVRVVTDLEGLTGYVAKYLAKSELSPDRIIPEELDAFLFSLRHTRKLTAWGLERREEEKNVRSAETPGAWWRR